MCCLKFSAGFSRDAPGPFQSFAQSCGAGRGILLALENLLEWACFLLCKHPGFSTTASCFTRILPFLTPNLPSPDFFPQLPDCSQLRKAGQSCEDCARWDDSGLGELILASRIHPSRGTGWEFSISTGLEPTSLLALLMFTSSRFCSTDMLQVK